MFLSLSNLLLFIKILRIPRVELRVDASDAGDEEQPDAGVERKRVH